MTHHLKRATFVGEETGGGYHGNNSGLGGDRDQRPIRSSRCRSADVGVLEAVPGEEGTTLPDYAVQTMTTAGVLAWEDEQLYLPRTEAGIP